MLNLSVFTMATLMLAQAPSVRRTPTVIVAETAGPAVVNIGAEIVQSGNPFRRARPFDDTWRDFFAPPRRSRTQRAESLGSGVIIDRAQGLVLTNEHVIARASSIRITLSDRRSFEVDVVSADPNFDIAVLKIRNGKNLPRVQLGTSSDLMPGEPVIAIGNPFGLSNTVTTGVVSALHRSIRAGERTYEDFIQTDAAINPGNSGGALLNVEGKLIGINTAIHREGSGIGFAIPIDKAMAVVEEVMRYGEVRPVDVGLDIDPVGTNGALVTKVESKSAAARANLRVGDRIIDIGGQEVASARAFWKICKGLVPGERTTMRFVRRGQKQETRFAVQELTFEKASKRGEKALGLRVKQSRKGGLLIKSVASRSYAARIGIKKGDFLLSVGGRSLRTTKDFRRICASIWDVDAVAVIIGRNGRRYYVTLRLGGD
jgi:serine protease Do